MSVDFQDFVKATVKKSDIPIVSTSKIQYPSGFMWLDYGAGSYLYVKDEDEVPLYTYHNVGIRQGSVNVIVAKSQGGKTTLAMKIAASIMEPYLSQMIHDKIMKRGGQDRVDISPENIGYPLIQILDTEKTLPLDYAKKVCQYTNKLVKQHVIINPITTDRDLMACLNQHIEYKVHNMKKIPMPMPDIFGRPILDYPPTFLIIDSMSQVLMEDVDAPDAKKTAKSKDVIDVYEDSIQNTAGARRAKIISALYSQLVNLADRYNIVIFSINHINKLLPVNGMAVKQYRGLRAGETIGGGERAIFLATSILRLDVIKNVSPNGSTSVNLGDNTFGHIAIASWIKSKSNSKSNASQLIYTNENGYDPLLSNLWMAKEEKILGEAGRFFYIPGYEEHKFTMKTYPEVFAANPKLFRALYYLCQDRCVKYLDDPDRAEKRNNELMQKIRKDIREDLSSGDMKRTDAMDMDDLFASMIND